MTEMKGLNKGAAMENFRKFCKNSVPVYFAKFMSTRPDNHDAPDKDKDDEERSFFHSDYLCNVLVGEQVAKYFTAVDNVDCLFRNGTLRVKLAFESWKLQDGSFSCRLVENEEIAAPVTKMGAKLIEVTSIMKNLLQRDPVLFYTAGDKQLIAQLLIPLNNSMGKLGRKISRLCQRVDEQRNAISEIVSRYTEREGDHVFLMEDDESETESVMDTAVVLKTRQPENIHRKLQKLWFFLTCTNGTQDIEDNSVIPPMQNRGGINRKIHAKRLLSKEELVGFRTAHTSQDVILSTNANSEKKVSLACTSENLCPPMDFSTVNFILSALTPPTSRVSNTDMQKGRNMDYWRRQSYEQVLQDTLLNDLDDLETIDDFYTDYEQNARTLSRIQRKIEKALNGDFSEESYDSDGCSQNTSVKEECHDGNQNEPSLINAKSGLISCITEEFKSRAIKSVDDMCNEKLHGENTIDSTLPATVNENNHNEITLSEEEKNSPGHKNTTTFRNDEEYFARFPLDPMACYEYNVSEMFSYINDVTNCLRSLENSWLQPYANEKVKGSPKYHKELADIVECLVFTMNALEDRLFSEQVYVEDRERIITVLKPVAETMTLCSSAFVDLTRMILKDAQYLQKIMDHFPIADTDIVVYDNDMILGSESNT